MFRPISIDIAIRKNSPGNSFDCCHYCVFVYPFIVDQYCLSFYCWPVLFILLLSTIIVYPFIVDHYCLSFYYVSPSNEGRHNVLVWFFLPLFDLEVKGQGPTKVIMVRDTPHYGHAPTYQISSTYLERKKSYGLDKLRW
jgi:hypothetical protein